MMSDSLMLYPVFALVFLTFAVGTRMVLLRVSAVKQGKIPLKYFKFNEGEIPKKIKLYSQNYDNLMALPLLFYVLVALVIVTKNESLILLIMAWLFAVLRFAHSYIHVGTNRVINRAKVWGLATLVLGLMWLVFFVMVTI